MPPNAAQVVETKYELTCQSCKAKMVDFGYPGGAGLRLGSPILRDPSDSTIGRCPRCKKHKMVVTKVPPPPEPVPVKGFAKVPVT